MFHRYTGSAGQVVDTGISVNAGVYGRTLLVIGSLHISSGDATSSFVLLVRCGYSGDHYSVDTIVNKAGSGSAGSMTISVSNNKTITITGTGPWQALVLSTREIS